MAENSTNQIIGNAKAHVGGRLKPVAGGAMSQAHAELLRNG